MSRLSATRVFAVFALCAFVCPLTSALRQHNQPFLGKVVSRVEDTVQKIQSIFHWKNTDGDHQVSEDGPFKIWAVLVAGSNGFYNYRHQADVCHAYQVLRSHGIPEENIITLMYDDIANSTENPTQGVIINTPGGPDVYKGVKKDYVGQDVTPENFLKVISGNAKGMNGIGSGRVVQSGPNDHIFINFVDHGAPGLLAFPSSELHARTLIDTLMDMYHNKSYGKLVMYIEACESGSMFEDLLSDDLNIFVTTAANAHEHSYACYYDSERGTYLGDVYSVMWMEDSERQDLNQESLFRQFSIVRRETNTSHVQEYGDLTIGKLKVAEFQGPKKNGAAGADNRKFVSPLLDAVPSGDVPLEILRHKLRASNSNEEANELQTKIHQIEKKRQHLIDVLGDIVEKASGGDKTKRGSIMSQRTKLKDFNCYETLVRAFSERCFHLPSNEYAYRQLFVLVNLCESSVPASAVVDAMASVCHPRRKYVGVI